MEEINQNQQIPAQVEPNKRWWVKYLLIGILGGIPVGILGLLLGIIINIFLDLIKTKYIQYTPISYGNMSGVGELAVFVLIMIPVAWVTFTYFTVYVGRNYQRLLRLGATHMPVAVEPLFGILGASLGLGITLQLLEFLRGVADFESLINNIILIAATSLGVFSGARFFTQIGHVLARKTRIQLLVKEPLVWFFPLFFLLNIILSMWLGLEDKGINSELNNLRLTNIQAQGSIVTSSTSPGGKIYKIDIVAQLNFVPKYSKYRLTSVVNTDQEGCHLALGCPETTMRPGDSQVKITCEGGQQEEVSFQEQRCNYNLLPWLSLEIENPRQWGAEMSRESIFIPWAELSQRESTCAQDSDCPQGLVCVGRGPTQPSKEIPGVCLSEKQSQGVQ